MRFGETMLDLENLNETELTTIINEAKRLRSRKADARNLREELTALLEGAKDRKFSLCNKYTGEVLIADDWIVYDEESQCPREGQWVH